MKIGKADIAGITIRLANTQTVPWRAIHAVLQDMAVPRYIRQDLVQECALHFLVWAAAHPGGYLQPGLLAAFVRSRATRFLARERRHWRGRARSRDGEDDVLLRVRAPGDLTVRRMALEGVMRLARADRVLVLARLFRQEEEIALSARQQRRRWRQIRTTLGAFVDPVIRRGALQPAAAIETAWRWRWWKDIERFKNRDNVYTQVDARDS